MGKNKVLHTACYDLTQIQLKLAGLSYLFTNLYPEDSVEIEQEDIGTGIGIILDECGKNIRQICNRLDEATLSKSSKHKEKKNK